MPIRAENRWLYPIDWQQLSGTIRFDRAGRRCEQCRRPHLRRVAHLGDGRWWTGRRTIMSYLVSPVDKARLEASRER